MSTDAPHQLGVSAAVKGEASSLARRAHSLGELTRSASPLARRAHLLGEFTRSASPLAHAMFLEARRYLPGGAELTASAAATAAKLKRNMKGYAVGRGLFVLYETPDTTWRALLGTTLNLLNACLLYTSPSPRD